MENSVAEVTVAVTLEPSRQMASRLKVLALVSAITRLPVVDSGVPALGSVSASVSVPVQVPTKAGALSTVLSVPPSLPLPLPPQAHARAQTTATFKLRMLWTPPLRALQREKGQFSLF